MKKVRFESQGEQIEGHLVFPLKIKNKNPGVILFHGLTSREDGYVPIAKRLATHGLVCLTLSIRGHGNSEGDFNQLTFKDAFIDGLQAYDFFAKHDFIDIDRIGILGTSVGGAIAVNIAASRNVKSLVLRAPAAYGNIMMNMPYREIIPQEYTIFHNPLALSDASTLKTISQFKGDLLVISCGNDEVIPTTLTSQYFEKAVAAHTTAHHIISDATHELKQASWREEFIDQSIDWLTKTLIR